MPVYSALIAALPSVLLVGAAINCRTGSDGRTPLSHAVAGGSLAVFSRTATLLGKCRNMEPRSSRSWLTFQNGSPCRRRPPA